MLDNHQLRDFFQSGFYERLWGGGFNEPESAAIAGKSIKLLAAAKGHVLDWCGGWGRISRHLPFPDFTVTILDFTEKYLRMARQSFPEDAGLTVIHADCRNTPSSIQADYAFCSFNSLGFFAVDEQLKAFQSLHGALKKNGRAIFDCMNQLFIARYFQPRLENPLPDGTRSVCLNRFEPGTSTLHTEFQWQDGAGNVMEERHFEQRLYTPLELKNLLQAAGFLVTAMYGNYDGDGLSFDLPQIVTVARKE